VPAIEFADQSGRAETGSGAAVSVSVHRARRGSGDGVQAAVRRAGDFRGVAAFVSVCVGETGVEMRFTGAVRATGAGPQLQGGASGVCETRGSHRAVAGGLGKRLAGKSATKHATQIAAVGFPVATDNHLASELRRSINANLFANKF